MPEEIDMNTNEKVLDELIKKAFEEIAEEEYQELLQQEKEWKKNPPYHFSETHEKRMKLMFRDYARGIDIEKKYGTKNKKR